MKISALQENIKRGISIVGHASGKNPNLPILSNILFDVKDGEIKLIATNLEIGIVNKVRGKIDQDGSIAVDAKMILDYISLLPNQKVNIETKDNNLLIESENYKTKIIGKNADDFPLIPKVDQEKNFSATINDFKKALSSIIFATSTSETRLELTGVFFEFSEKELIMAATDSFRLSEKKIVIIKHFKNNEEDDSNNKMKLIIPSKTLQELSRVLSVISESELNDEDDGRINFYISDNQVLFKFLNTELVSRLIDGQFPDYTQIIPVKSTTQILINKNNLIRAIKSSAIFTKTGANDINLDFIKADNKTIISASSGAVGENIVEIETVIDGEDNKVIVNYKYLLDGLQVIDGDTIKIEVVNNNTPCIIRSDKTPDYLYVIMPIRQ